MDENQLKCRLGPQKASKEEEDIPAQKD